MRKALASGTEDSGKALTREHARLGEELGVEDSRNSWFLVDLGDLGVGGLNQDEISRRRSRLVSVVLTVESGGEP